MCGIIGLLLADKDSHCCSGLFDGLQALQHRGQDAAGIVTASLAGHTKFHSIKKPGLARDVFTSSNLRTLKGPCGLAHCRYPTARIEPSSLPKTRSFSSVRTAKTDSITNSAEEAQPFYINYPCGLALAHNGNLTNSSDLRDWILRQHRHLNTDSDSEILLNVFGEKLRETLSQGEQKELFQFTPEDVFKAMEKTMKMVRGGYAVTMLIHDLGVVAFRDPNGIRPLVIGRRDSSTIPGGVDYCFASESVALDTMGYELWRDVKPGECVLVVPMDPEKPRENLGFFSQHIISSEVIKPCLFEYVYFARPDSVMNGVDIYEARMNMGEFLAHKIMNELGEGNDIDVVLPIPDTSRLAALKCAEVMKLPYSEGYIKNRYIARTFIMPDQASRKKNLRLKLNTVKSIFKNKNILLVDDSIVRGNTSQQIIQMAREAGARKVYFASAAPEIRFPNIYGIDLPTKEELIAYERSVEEMAKVLGADKLFFQTYADLEESVKRCNQELKSFEGSTFTGVYVTEK